MQQVEEDFFHEKEQLLLEKEKVSLLTKKLEAMISQYPAFPHGPQVLESSTLNRTTLIRQRDSPSFEEEQSAAGRCKKQKSLQDYLKPIKIGARLQLFCHGVPKQIMAEGIVVSIIEERGVEPRFVKVYIEKTVMPNEKLTRSQEDVRKIGDAVHKCIEWEIVNVMEI